MWQVIGQTRAVSLLQRSLEQGRLSHAYLFVGPPHVGKMTLALNLAQALNCEGREPPCGECHPCRRIAVGNHADVRVIGLAGPDSAEGKARAEIGIDQIREMQRATSLPPFEGKHKVFIIEEAERLSPEASNCLLKTLEEPPTRVLIVLLAVKEGNLLPTILSRCHRVELPPLAVAEVEQALTQRWQVDPQRAKLLARLSRGSLGWAVCAEASDRFLLQRSQRLAELLSLDSAGAEARFAYAAQLAALFIKNQQQAREVLEMWLGWWRDLLLVRGGHSQGVCHIDLMPALASQANGYTLGQIKGAVESLKQAMEQLDLNANPRLVLEVLMLSLPSGGRGEKLDFLPDNSPD